MGKSPEKGPSEPELQPVPKPSRSAAPVAPKPRPNARPPGDRTELETIEQRGLSVAPIAPMLPDNGADDMLFTLPGRLGSPPLNDLYSIETMLDIQTREILNASDLDCLPGDLRGAANCAGDGNATSEPFAIGSGEYDGVLDFDDMFDLNNAATSSESPLVATMPNERIIRRRTDSVLATNRAAGQPLMFTPEASRCPSSQRAVTPDDGDWSSRTTQRAGKAHPDTSQQIQSELAPPHTESRCMKQALSLSYKAHFCSKQGGNTNTAAIFQLLSQFRQCVQALASSAGCMRCTSSAPFMTLLADVCERLGRGLVRMTTLSSQVNVEAQDETQQLTYGYTVDSQEETVALFGMIATRHLAVLRQVAAKIKARASMEKCRPALMVLQETDKRLAGIEQFLNSAAARDKNSFLELDEDADMARF